jgi:hypothetical protein
VRELIGGGGKTYPVAGFGELDAIQQMEKRDEHILCAMLIVETMQTSNDKGQSIRIARVTVQAVFGTAFEFINVSNPESYPFLELAHVPLLDAEIAHQAHGVCNRGSDHLLDQNGLARAFASVQKGHPLPWKQCLGNGGTLDQVVLQILMRFLHTMQDRVVTFD